MQDRMTTNRTASRSEHGRYVIRCLGFALLLIFAFAALKFPTRHWCDVVTTATVFALFTAILRVVYGDGANRALWLGFAIFGWGTLILLSIPEESFAVHYPPHVLGRLALKITGGLSAPRAPSFFMHLTQIVNCIFVWLMAGLGALAGWWTCSNNQPAP